MNKGITAIYSRVAQPSTPDDTVAVLQRESLVRYAEGQGYGNIECYDDTGFSGLAFTARPGFQRLQEDINAGKVQRVIVKNESRIGRNTAEVIRWISSLQAKGIQLIATAHPAFPLEAIQTVYGIDRGVAANG